MLKIAVIDSNYNDQKYSGLAASWLHWEMKNAGISECPSNEADYLLITVSSQQGISDVKREIKRTKNTHAKIILGGGGCYAPAIFDDIADVICVGEGTNFIRTFLQNGFNAVYELPETWIPGETRPVIPGKQFPWEIPPLNHPDGTIRVFASRGCKYRCLFCQTGWENEYRINPDMTNLKNQIDTVEKLGRRIAIVTNDAAEESLFIQGQQEFLSVRMDNLKRIMPLSRKQVKSVRIGVEGISERLRSAIGKPVTNEDLLRYSFHLLSVGIGVRWFFIPGLPGEKDSDYSELQYLVDQLHKLPKGVVMMNFHAFIPMPATPLGIFPLVDDYWERFDEFRRWFFHGPGFTRHVQIIAPSQYPSRMRRAMESMAATESELRRGWMEYENKNWRVRYLASPEKLREIAKFYAHRVGCTNGTPELSKA